MMHVLSDANGLPLLGVDAILCCYKRLTRLTTQGPLAVARWSLEG